MLYLAEIPFASLSTDEFNRLNEFAICEEFDDGDIVFQAGDDNVDVFVVESGALAILNPNDNNSVLVTHHAGQFSGDIDVLKCRPIVVNGIAQGKTRVLRVPSERMREVLTRIPTLSEKFLNAFQARRELMSTVEKLGSTVLGPGKCRHTTELREFLYK